MLDKYTRAQALRRLLDQARLSEEEVTCRLEDALSPEYWRALNSQLKVCASPAEGSAEVNTLGGREQEGVLRNFEQAGYFKVGPLWPDEVVEGMREAVEALMREGWPPVFAFVYDEFWTAARSPSLTQVLSALLGPGYRQTSHVWTYYVPPRGGAGGWPPHVDGRRGRKRVTVWMALSDATLDNGCMYVIPHNQVPAKLMDDFNAAESLSQADVSELLQSSRALPARAGSILCWDYGTIHWGSKCSGEGGPRISIGMSFIGEETEPTDKEPPLFGGGAPAPTFAERIRAISKAIVTYHRREPLMVRYLDLAEALLRRESEPEDKPS